MYNNSLHVNPTVRNFWRNLKKNEGDFHPFKKNKNLVFFGDELSQKSYEYISARINKIFEQEHFLFINQQVSQCYLLINHLEKDNTENLQSLAVEAVSQAFEVPENLLESKLNENSNIETNSTEEKFKEVSYDSLDQDTKDQINKRILMNCVIQGASIHSFYTLHHIVKDQIDKINPMLIDLYDKFSVGSARSYFSIDYSSFLSDKNFEKSALMGSSEVEYQNENENPKVVANAQTFPVLCQELVKGSIEILCLHSLQDISKEKLEAIYYFADKRQDEPRYIQIGSEIWRNILDFNKYCTNNQEKMSLPELIMKINKIPVKEIEDFFEFILQKEYDKAINYISLSPAFE